jgi:hypothetical protein
MMRYMHNVLRVYVRVPMLSVLMHYVFPKTSLVVDASWSWGIVHAAYVKRGKLLGCLPDTVVVLLAASREVLLHGYSTPLPVPTSPLCRRIFLQISSFPLFVYFQCILGRLPRA